MPTGHCPRFFSSGRSIQRKYLSTHYHYPNMLRSPSRRTFLRMSSTPISAAAGGLRNGDLPDLRYHNTGHEVTVTTIIKRVADGETVFSDATTIARDETRRHRSPIREEGLFRTHVSVEDGPKNTHERDAPKMESYGLSRSLGTTARLTIPQPHRFGRGCGRFSPTRRFSPRPLYFWS